MKFKYISSLVVSAMTAFLFVLFNNFSSYTKNPASDLLLEYDRLQEEASLRKLSKNGSRYLDRVSLEISNRIAYRLKIKDCNEFFNEHPKAKNGKYILYPNNTTEQGTVISCEKNMESVNQRRIGILDRLKTSPQRQIQSEKSFHSQEVRPTNKSMRKMGFGSNRSK